MLERSRLSYGYEMQPRARKFIVMLTLWVSCVLSGATVGCGATESSPPHVEGVLLPSGRVGVLPYTNTEPSPRKGARVMASEWHVTDAGNGNRLSIVTERGFCSGDQPPKLIGVHIEKRSKRVFIIAYLEYVDHPPRADCLRYGGLQRGVVLLDGPVADFKIFDATPSPPQIRWPLAAESQQ